MIRHSLSIAALLLFLAPGIVRADDDFYETRLAIGKKAYADKHFDEASNELRVAAFGFLDRPALLSETCVWLALAESANGRADGLHWALARFTEIEVRFHPYKEIALDPSIRSAFEKLLVATLSRESIASIPTLADLVKAPLPTVKPAPVRDNSREIASALKQARAFDSQGKYKDVIEPATRVLALEPQNREALKLRARANAATGACSQAAKDLNALGNDDVSANVFICYAGLKEWDAAQEALKKVPPPLTTRADVADAVKRMNAAKLPPPAPPTPLPASAPAPQPTFAVHTTTMPEPAPQKPPVVVSEPANTAPTITDATRDKSTTVADSINEAKRLLANNQNAEAASVLQRVLVRAPDHRFAHLLLLQASTRNHDWNTATAQIRFIEPFQDDENVTMFYAAVALYHTGKLDQAKTLLQRSLPKLAPSPYVQLYKQKILGQ